MSQRPSLPQLYGRIGGLRLRATHDPHQYTAAGRRAFLDRFEREVDPDGTLPPAERAARAEAARKAYMAALAAKSAAVRGGAARQGRDRITALERRLSRLEDGGDKVDPAAIAAEPAETSVIRVELRDEAAAAPSEPTR